MAERLGDVAEGNKWIYLYVIKKLSLDKWKDIYESENWNKVSEVKNDLAKENPNNKYKIIKRKKLNS